MRRGKQSKTKFFFFVSLRGGLCRLAAWLLQGGPVGPLARWAATSYVELGQTINPVNRGRIRREGQIHTQKGREWGMKQGRGPGDPQLRKEVGGLYLDLRAGILEFLLTPLLMGQVCLLS